MHAPLPPPREVYRQFLQNLRYIPDPQVWAYFVPRFKERLVKCYKPLQQVHDRADYIGPETSRSAEARANLRRRDKDVKELRTMLAHVRMTIACHPHALQRTLEWSYGQRGTLRHERILNVIQTCPIPDQDWPPEAFGIVPITSADSKQGTTYPPLPADVKVPETKYPPCAFQPLPAPLKVILPARPQTVAQGKGERLKRPTRKALLKAVADETAWNWENAKVPLVFPSSSTVKTGWEGKGVVEALRTIAGIKHTPVAPGKEYPAINPRDLPTYMLLPSSLKAVLPKRFKGRSPPDPFQRPRPAMTRENPGKFRHPQEFTLRLMERTYREFWDGLVWVRSQTYVPKEKKVKDVESKKGKATNGKAKGKVNKDDLTKDGVEKDEGKEAAAPVEPEGEPRTRWSAGSYEVCFGFDGQEKVKARWTAVRKEEQQWL